MASVPVFAGIFGQSAKKPRRAGALRGGMIQLLCSFNSKADGNIGLVTDGLCADAQRGKLEFITSHLLKSFPSGFHNVKVRFIRR